MGYTIEYFGKFNLNKPLTKCLAKYLNDFSRTRHFRRNIEGFGFEGEYFVDPCERKFNFWKVVEKYEKLGLSNKEICDRIQEEYNVINYNENPKTQPGLWCQWIPTNDRMGIEWDGNEKFYNAIDWLNYIIKNFLIPKRYVVNGEVRVKDSQRNEFEKINAKIIVDNNDVRIEY